MRANTSTPSRRGIYTLIAMLSFFSTGGCHRHDPVLPPNVVVDNNANKRILFSIDVAGQEAIVGDITGRVQYDIKNAEHCVPLDMTLARGGTLRNFPQIYEMKRSEVDGEFYLFEDYLKGDDYYRLGACRWGVTAVEFKVNINGKYVSFWINEDDLRGMAIVSRRCLYPKHRKSDIDTDCREDVPDDDQTNDESKYFRMYITPRRG